MSLTSIEVTPAQPSLAAGTSTQLVATGIYSDSSTADLTEEVAWSSGDVSVATVDDTPGSRGLAVAVVPGMVQISAEFDSVVGETSLTVTAAVLVSLEVMPTNPSIALGTSQPFQATGIFSDGSKQDMTHAVTWDSTDLAVATPSGSMAGVADSATVGSTTITATMGAVSGSSELTVTPAVLVTIEISPTNPSIALGTGQPFQATGIFSDGTNQDLTDSATWSSDAAGVATVENTPGSAGAATSVATGSTQVSADVGGIVGSTTLTVTPAELVSISVTPANPSVPLGLDQSFAATGLYTDGTRQDLTDDVTWLTSDGATVQVSNATGSRGLAATLATGTATVSAVSNAVTGSTGIMVTPPVLVSIGITPVAPSIALGTAVELSATGLYTDDTTRDLTAVVLWSSSDTAVATVSNAGGSEGLTTGLATGSSTVTALHQGVSSTTALTITPATLVTLEVTPSHSSLPLGLSQPFAATGTFTDATVQDLTTSVTWSSSDPGIASVSNGAGSKGIGAGVAAGSTTISAALQGVSGSTGFTITSAALTSIDIVADETSVPLGLTEPLEARGFYTDGSSQDLTPLVAWTSSDSNVAVVSSASGSGGFLTAVGTGITTVTATLGSTTGTLEFTVTPAVLTAIALEPDSPSVPLGFAQQFAAVGTYSDGSELDLTASVAWSSSDMAVGEVSNAAGTHGFFSSLSVGTTTVTASAQGISGSTDQTVTNATLTSISIAPSASSIVLGTQAELTATGHFSDASTMDLTTTVTWSSSDTGIATLSNAAGSKGLAQSVAIGTTTVTATFGGVSGMTTLDVVALTLVSIAVTPADGTAPMRTNIQYVATGTFNDASTQDVTVSASWKSSSGHVATIGGKGKAKTHNTGMCEISATIGSVVGTTMLTVTP